MKYIIENSKNAVFLKEPLQILMQEYHCEYEEIYVNKVYIVVSDDVSLLNNLNQMIYQNTFGTTEKYIKDGESIHLIIINSNLCADMSERELVAVILHELGHIFNHFKSLSHQELLLSSFSGKGLNVDEEWKKILLNREFYADFYARKHGFKQELIHLLRGSLSKGYNDTALLERIRKIEIGNEELIGSPKL